MSAQVLIPVPPDLITVEWTLGASATAGKPGGFSNWDLDHEIELIRRTLRERGPSSRDELWDRLGGRSWGPRRFNSALREAVLEGAALRLARGRYGPPPEAAGDGEYGAQQIEGAPPGTRSPTRWSKEGVEVGLANVLVVMPSTQTHILKTRLRGPHIFHAAVATGVVGGLVTGLFFLPVLAAIGVGAGVALLGAGTLIATDLRRRLQRLESEQDKLHEQLPEHLAAHEASIERLHGDNTAVVNRVERLERKLVRPDLRELTDLATEQGWEWWRGSDVVRFASPRGIELTFELPVEDGERRTEIARQLEAFGLRWSAPPTHITASQRDRSRR